MSSECKVILDTSVLLQVYNGVDVIELINDEALGRCQYYILDSVINELMKLLSDDRSKKRKAASTALKYITKHGVKVLTTNYSNLTADEALIRFFKEDATARRSFTVATNDNELKEKLLAMGVKVLTWWASRFKFELVEP